VFYISPDKTKLRAMQYEWTKDNWLSQDLTFFSEHITDGRVIDMAWAQNPSNLLVMALEDGTAAWLTYERGENIWGWHRHDTQGDIKDFASGSYNGTSIIAMATERNTDEIMIEVAYEDESQYMDSWIKVTGSDIETVTGLDHLEGLEVQVMTDGAIHPNKTVASNEIDLDWPADSVVVGLQYTPRLVTLPLDKGAQTGSAISHRKRYNKLIVGLLDSYTPLINGTRMPTRYPETPMDTSMAAATYEVHQDNMGWSDNAEIVIEQDLPLPTNVAYIGGQVGQEST